MFNTCPPLSLKVSTLHFFDPAILSPGFERNQRPVFFSVILRAPDTDGSHSVGRPSADSFRRSTLVAVAFGKLIPGPAHPYPPSPWFPCLLYSSSPEGSHPPPIPFLLLAGTPRRLCVPPNRGGVSRPPPLLPHSQSGWSNHPFPSRSSYRTLRLQCQRQGTPWAITKEGSYGAPPLTYLPAPIMHAS